MDVTAVADLPLPTIMPCLSLLVLRKGGARSSASDLLAQIPGPPNPARDTLAGRPACGDRLPAAAAAQQHTSQNADAGPGPVVAHDRSCHASTADDRGEKKDHLVLIVLAGGSPPDIYLFAVSRNAHRSCCHVALRVRRMTSVSSVSPTGNPYIDGVLVGTKWATNTLTYSFPSSPADYGAGYGSGEPGKAFKPFTAAQQAAVQHILAMDSAVANLTFTKVTETTTTHAVIRYAESNAPSTGWGYYPGTAASSGDVWLNNSTHWYD